MNANDFVSAWRSEKDALLAVFTDPASGSATARLFSELQLNSTQQNSLAAALNAALTDTFYTLLLGLDGAAQIGGVQQQFHISNPDGTLVAKPGEIEASAWEQFQTT